jgi:hypothetical protein
VAESGGLSWGSPAGLVRSGRVLREHDFLHPASYRCGELVHRLDNAETVARIIRESDGMWLPLNHSQLGGAGATHSERGNVMADESPTRLHAFSSGPRGPLSRRSQLSSFDARRFTPPGHDGNTSSHAVSWSPVRPVHTTRPMTQTTMWLAVHLLTAYNVGGLDRAERRLLDQGWHSAGQACSPPATPVEPSPRLYCAHRVPAADGHAHGWTGVVATPPTSTPRRGFNAANAGTSNGYSGSTSNQPAWSASDRGRCGPATCTTAATTGSVPKRSPICSLSAANTTTHYTTCGTARRAGGNSADRRQRSASSTHCAAQAPLTSRDAPDRDTDALPRGRKITNGVVQSG